MHAGHTVDDDQLEPPGASGQVIAVHDVHTVNTGTELRARYGLTSWLLPEVLLPIRTVFVRPEFADVDGNSVKEGESIHHRKETIAGVGDLRLTAVMPLVSDPEGPSVTVRAGVSIPTGHTEPDPVDLGRRGHKHQHIFFGSGTFDPVVGLETWLPAGAFVLGAQADAQLPLYEGEFDYRQGARVNGQLGVHWLLEEWRFGLHPGLYYETASKWGTTPAENSGRVDLLGSASAGWAPADGPAISLTLGRPIKVWTDGGQFDTDIQATLNVGWRMGGGDDAP